MGSKWVNGCNLGNLQKHLQKQMGVQLLWTIRPYLHIYDEFIDQGVEHLHQVGGVNSGDFISSLRLSNGYNECFWESQYSSWNSGPHESGEKLKNTIQVSR